MQKLFVICQYLAPQILLSKLAGFLADTKIKFLKNFFIRTFIKLYKVNLQDAIYEDPTQYQSFNDFFTRKLKPQARPLAAGIISPVDGFIYHYGDIKQDMLIQAKNHHFKLADLLGGNNQIAEFFIDKNFITLYLAPRHYHRVHMPTAGKLLNMIYVPGKLFSVNPVTVANIPNLFARNERVICLFQTEQGKMCVILIGAMLVGSIHTAWHGSVGRDQQLRYWDYAQKSIYLNKGEEIGFFAMGSSVIVLFEDKKKFLINQSHIDKELKMGEEIAV